MQTVYWSTIEIRDAVSKDLSLAYRDPEPLRDAIPKHIKDSPYGKCPAFFETIKNTYVLRSPVSFKLKLDQNSKEYATDNDDLFKSKFIAPHDIHGIAQFNFGYMFFSEKPLIMSQSHPYLHNNTYTRNGNVAYGEFDIGRWLRNIACAIILDPNLKQYEFNITNNDIFSYTKFHTDEKIILKRFDMTDKIREISYKCFDYKLRKSRGIDSLYKVYEAFERARYRKPLLREIKANLLE